MALRKSYQWKEQIPWRFNTFYCDLASHCCYMTRLSLATRFSLLFFFNFNLKPTRFLSILNLSRLSLSTLHLCKSLARLLASKTLALFTMDDLFPNDDEFWDIDVGSRSRPPQRPRLLDDFDYDDIDGEKVYFVPFRYCCSFCRFTWRVMKFNTNGELGLGIWWFWISGRWVCCSVFGAFGSLVVVGLIVS